MNFELTADDIFKKVEENDGSIAADDLRVAFTSGEWPSAQLLANIEEGIKRNLRMKTLKSVGGVISIA